MYKTWISEGRSQSPEELRPGAGAPKPTAEPRTFFEFPEDRYWPGGPTRVALGPADLIRTQFSEDRLLKTFGSYVTYVDEGSGKSFLGVWHSPRVEHFYRALRARGVPVEVTPERPSELRLLRRMDA